MEDEDEAQSPSRSQSQSASRSPSPVQVAVVPPSSSPHHANGSYAGPVTVTVTVAAPAPPHHAVPVAVPIHPVRSPAAGGGGGGGGGGREDCWSEGATSTLIDAWGDRYLELSRGNLKQKHWQEVAEAVTSRDGYTRASKSDIQCKNRIDTLKKKYKAEKTKISASGGSATSSWPFFQRLDSLLGPTHKPAPAPPASGGKIPAGIPLLHPARRHQPIPQRKRSAHPSLRKPKPSPPPSASSKSAGSSADSSDGFPPPRTANGKRPHQRPAAAVAEKGKAAELQELTRAILRFAEVYERVESTKLRQAMEMEKQRMEFTRELELQRMEFLMKTQMELSQLKSHHHGSGSIRKRRKMDDAGGSSNHQHHNNNTNTNTNTNPNPNSSNNSDNDG